MPETCCLQFFCFKHPWCIKSFLFNVFFIPDYFVEAGFEIDHCSITSCSVFHCASVIPHGEHKGAQYTCFPQQIIACLHGYKIRYLYFYITIYCFIVLSCELSFRVIAFTSFLSALRNLFVIECSNVRSEDRTNEDWQSRGRDRLIELQILTTAENLIAIFYAFFINANHTKISEKVSGACSCCTRALEINWWWNSKQVSTTQHKSF